jgi:hypothetical protein
MVRIDSDFLMVEDMLRGVPHLRANCDGDRAICERRAMSACVHSTVEGA